MENQKERLVEFAGTLGLTQRQLEFALGLSSGTLSHSTDGLSQKVLKKVFAAYPNLNPVWLLTGQGEMTIETGTTNNVYATGGSAASIYGSATVGAQSSPKDKKRIAELEAEVNELKAKLYDLLTKK